LLNTLDVTPTVLRMLMRAIASLCIKEADNVFNYARRAQTVIKSGVDSIKESL